MSGRLIVWMIIAVLMALIVGVPATFVTVYRGSEEATNITVTGKERAAGSSSVWLVFTEGETFAVADTFSYMRFTSSDVYGRIKVGKTYRVHVAGWRVPILSMYRNIIRVEAEVSDAG